VTSRNEAGSGGWKVKRGMTVELHVVEVVHGTEPTIVATDPADVEIAMAGNTDQGSLRMEAQK